MLGSSSLVAATAGNSLPPTLAALGVSAQMAIISVSASEIEVTSLLGAASGSSITINGRPFSDFASAGEDV